MRLMLTFAIIMGLTTVACEKKKKKETYSYDFTINGCATGRHTFGSVAALCEGLFDDARNKGCAGMERLEMARSRNCPQLNSRPRTAAAPRDEVLSPGPAAPAQPQQDVQVIYSYQISVNGCDTGRHEFTGSNIPARICAALLDDELNNNCAREERVKRAENYGCR